MRKLLIYIVLLTAVSSLAQQPPPAADQGPGLSEQLIQQVLEPLRTGIQAQNVDSVLAVFDQQELDSYPDLPANLRAFFQNFSQIDMRYQLLQAAADKDSASATVDMQMDALPYEPTQIAVRRSTQTRLQLKLGPKGWKIAAFTPADFFNVEYSPK